MNTSSFARLLLITLLGVATSALALPTVSITSPTNNQNFGAPVDITIKANATASSGATITKVEFFNGSTSLGSVAAAPYQWVWKNVPINTTGYTLTAKATDRTGTTTSAKVIVTVKTNVAPNPTLSLTSPPTSNQYGANVAVKMVASATDGDGTITKIEILEGTTNVIGLSTIVPFNFTWTPPVPTGTTTKPYALTSRATDNSGGVKTLLTAVNITVYPAPTVSLTSPSDGTSFPPGSTIALKATASGNGGATISKVEFLYNGSNLAAPADTTSPYTGSWTPANGTYTVTARATDNKGGTATTAPITVSVNVPHIRPDITITSPTSGALLDTPANVTFNASATAYDGATITKVEYFEQLPNTTPATLQSLGAPVTAPPYSFTWNNVPAGGHLVVARATDSQSATKDSALTYVIVDGADSCTNAPPLTANDSVTRLAKFGELPLLFEQNTGQTSDRVKFLARGRDFQLFLADATSTVAMRGSDGRQAAVGMRFEGGNKSPPMHGEEPTASVTNYLIGSDRGKWRSHIPNFASVRYESVYDGIDAVYHARDGQLEYDLHVAPRVDPGKVRMAFDGVEHVELDAHGDLLLRTVAGMLTQKRPIAYQLVDGERRAVDARYRLTTAGLVEFEVGAYDRDRTLVIDPVMVYSTYLGGTNSSSGAYAIAISRCGEAFVSGWTWATDYPTTAGAFDRTNDTSSQMGFVTKLNAAGTGLVYSTFVSGSNYAAGSGFNAQFTDLFNIAIDATGHAYVAGSTNSIDFPVTPNSFMTTAPSTSASNVVAKLTRDGGALSFATYLNAGTGLAGGFAVDSAGNSYLGSGARLYKLAADGTSIVYTFNASGVDSISALAVDAAGNAYLTGTTSSSLFPTTTGAFETTRPNSTSFPSGYVTKVNPTGTGSVWSTYFGNRGSTTPRAITLDPSNNVYIAGEADAAGFPVALGGGRTFNMDLDNNNLNKYAFAARLSADGTHGDWFSRIGGFHCASGASQCVGARTVANAIALDSTQAVWIAGTTESNRLPLVKALNANFSANAVDNLAMKLAPDGNSMAFGTILNGTTVGTPGTRGLSDSSATGVAVDAAGSAYIVGWTNKLDYPTTAGAYQTVPRSNVVANAFVTKINETKDTTTTLTASPNPGHAGANVTFTATVTGNAPSGAVSFYDGSNVMGTASLSGTTAQYVTSTLAGGSHTITASYPGDARNNASTSAPLSLPVDSPTAMPTMSITGISDSESLVANSGTSVTGKQVTVTASAAAGNILRSMNLYTDLGTYRFTLFGPTTSQTITLMDLPQGFHVLYGDATDNFGNVFLAPYIRFAVNVAGAVPPTLTMTSPANGATLTLPGPFALTATGSASGSTTFFGVTFDTGSQQVFAMDGPNYTASWTPAGPGSYRIVAKAGDTSSGFGISPPITVNVISPPTPTVTITAPASGSTFWTNDTVTITATATPVSGTTISRVDFLSDGSVIGSSTTAPYGYAWTGMTAGAHVLTAKAYDNRGISGTSPAVSVTINSPPVPTVSITSPASGSSYSTPANIAFTVNATPASGATIARVDFLDSGTVVGTSNSAPFGWTWSNAPVGSHSIIAKATDTRGASSTSNLVNLSVAFGQPTIDAAPGLDGSSVSASTVLVRGTVQAPANSGVTVNGVLASLAPDGSFFLDDVPLVMGSNSIVLQLTTQDGQTASRTIIVNRTGTEAFKVTVTPQEELSGSNFTFVAANISGQPVASIEFDFNGDGGVEYTATSFDPGGITVTLTGAGIVQPVLRFKDAGGNLLGTVTKRIYLHDPADVYRLLKGVYTDFTGRLATGNASSADNLLAPHARAIYDPVFAALGPDLATIVPQLGGVHSINASLSTAEIAVLRGTGTTAQAFFIHMLRAGDGIWRIESM